MEPFILHAGRMAEGFEVFGNLKPSKEGPALVAVHDHRDTFVQSPIDHGKERKAQSIGEWDTNNAYCQNETAEGSVEIFGQIELTALTDRAVVEKGLEAVDFPDRGGAMRTGQVPRMGLHVAGLLALVASKGDRLSHREMPNLTQ